MPNGPHGEHTNIGERLKYVRTEVTFYKHLFGMLTYFPSMYTLLGVADENVLDGLVAVLENASVASGATCMECVLEVQTSA